MCAKTCETANEDVFMVNYTESNQALVLKP